MKKLIFTSISLLLIFPQSLQAQSKISWGGSLGGNANSFVYSIRDHSTPNPIDTTIFSWNYGLGLECTGFSQIRLSEKTFLRIGLSIFHLPNRLRFDLPPLIPGVMSGRWDRYHFGLPMGIMFQLSSGFYTRMGIEPNVMVAHSLSERIRSVDGTTTRITEWSFDREHYRRLNIGGQMVLGYELVKTDTYRIGLFSLIAIDFKSQLDTEMYSSIRRALRIGGGIELVSIR